MYCRAIICSKLQLYQLSTDLWQLHHLKMSQWQCEHFETDAWNQHVMRPPLIKPHWRDCSKESVPYSEAVGWVEWRSLSAFLGFAFPLVRLLAFIYHWAWKPWEAHADLGHMDARALLTVCLSFSHERKSRRMSKGFLPWRYMVLFVGKVCWSWLFRFIQRVGH